MTKFQNRYAIDVIVRPVLRQKHSCKLLWRLDTIYVPTFDNSLSLETDVAVTDETEVQNSLEKNTRNTNTVFQYSFVLCCLIISDHSFHSDFKGFFQKNIMACTLIVCIEMYAAEVRWEKWVRCAVLYFCVSITPVIWLIWDCQGNRTHSRPRKDFSMSVSVST